MTNTLLTLLIGCITGFASGLMGIGGGAIGTPLIRLILNAPPLIALATPMPVMLPSSISGGVAYLREKKIDFALAKWILIAAVPMTWVGATVTSYVSDVFLMVLTALFLMVIGSSFLIRSIILKPVPEVEATLGVNRVHALLAGVLGGFMAGLLAIGGGVIYVPLLIRVFKRPMKVALATSLAVVTCVAIPGTIKHAMLGHIDWKIAGLLAISVIPFSFLGARLALRLKNRTLEHIFGIWTIGFGVYFLFSQL